MSTIGERKSERMTTSLLSLAYNAAEDKKAEDIVVLNMEGVSIIADQFIICHANSERQVQSIAREVADQASKAGFAVKRLEGFDSGRWILSRSWRCCCSCIP